MTYEQYWHGPPRLVETYRELHKLKIQQRNEELWLQGLYNYDALAVCLNNTLSKRRKDYMKEPLKLFPPTEDEQKKQVEETRQKIVEKLNAFKAAFEKNTEAK